MGKARENIIIPARIDDALTKRIRETAVAIYKIFGCSGTARVDFLVNRNTKQFYANEINTLPGTLYHHLWKASGVNLDKLLDELIRLAQEKHRAKKDLTSSFASNILVKTHTGKLKFNAGE